MASGNYKFKVTAECSGSCTNYWMSGSYSTVVGEGCAFSINTATSPPPSPPPPGGASPSIPTLLPILKEFTSTYGNSVFSTNKGTNYDFNPADSNKDCNQICFAGSGRRRLLFGGLGYVSGQTGWLLCNNFQKNCNCPFGPK